MAITATCAVSEVSRRPSSYRAEQYDPDLGLYDLRARYYNPLTGRFMSRDPRQVCDCSLRHPASLHSYGYASADPVNRVDPSGRADAVEEQGIDSEISLQDVGRKTVPKGAFWGGIGLTGLGLEVACMYYTDAAGVSVVGQNLGSPQSVALLGAICSALSSKVPGRPLGPYPEPFYPDEKWATSPGSPWRCEADAEGWIVFCRAPCPDGGEQSITWDPGNKYGEPPHRDVHLCKGNKTCKIYLDGTSTCPPGSFPPWLE